MDSASYPSLLCPYPTRPPDLHKIGGLPVLLELLESPHASLRWRAAEVVATCVANNPPVQEVGGVRGWGAHQRSRKEGVEERGSCMEASGLMRLVPWAPRLYCIGLTVRCLFAWHGLAHERCTTRRMHNFLTCVRPCCR